MIENPFQDMPQGLQEMVLDCMRRACKFASLNQPANQWGLAIKLHEVSVNTEVQVQFALMQRKALFEMLKGSSLGAHSDKLREAETTHPEHLIVVVQWRDRGVGLLFKIPSEEELANTPSLIEPTSPAKEWN